MVQETCKRSSCNKRKNMKTYVANCVLSTISVYFEYKKNATKPFRRIISLCSNNKTSNILHKRGYETRKHHYVRVFLAHYVSS
ncbi:hypothetical protein Y1Q_0007768 [Alligator mississippiensis]|uniref:Uncharacterized protein n=1 Tax=Alligator mississippiensis TaxID=8496 RepID=A0A151N737_ALLMI|nr:hypothetical protein Y1Q_0007768 [Alligator mississippiensis]